MKALLLLSLALTGCAGVATKAQVVRQADGAALLEARSGPVCLVPGTPNEPYTRLGKVLAVKRSYGERDSVVKPLADEARSYGANAVVSYEHGMRLTGKLSGVVVPYARGTAVYIDNLDTNKCVSLGGEEK